MKRVFILLMIMLCLPAVSSNLLATTTYVNFDAVALRGANPTYNGTSQPTGTLPFVSEYPNGNGAYAVTEYAGQKAYYGTSYFDGWKLSDIYSVTFSYKPVTGSNPYMNIVIANGSGAYGVISSQGGYVTSGSEGNSLTYYFSGKSGNSENNYNFKFYEGVDTALSGTVLWNTICDWYILGVGEIRPLSNGELTNADQPGAAKAPLVDGLAVMWGDSQNNYLGEKHIWDVTVTDKNGNNYIAAPEPTSLVLLGLGLVGLVGGRRKFLG